jgi:hypothetical protein
LLLQALIPNGFMPGRLSDGWLFVLCPQGLPSEFVRQLHHDATDSAHHAGHIQGDAAGSAPGNCELGGALDQPVDVDFANVLQGFELTAASYADALTPHIAKRTVRDARARAPPNS